MADSFADSLVSVVLPTHNRPAMLKRAVSSVLEQTYENIELIVVDDASSPGADRVLREVSDKRLIVLRNEKKLGGSASRNRGIEKSRGVYTAFLDDDDSWLPTKIDEQIACFEKASPRVGMVYTGYRYETTDGRVVPGAGKPIVRQDVLVALLRGCITTTSTATIRRDCLDEVGGFDENMPAAQEWDLWIRLAKRFHFEYVARPLTRLTIHGDQLSADLKRKIEARRLIFDKYSEDIGQHPDILRDHLKRLGVLHLLASEKGTGRRFLLRCLEKKIFQPDVLAHLILSLAPGLYARIVKKYGMFNADGITFFH